MSDIKPVSWLYKARIAGTDTWETQVYSRKPVADSDWTKDITPLYTSEQLAEAVVAERERCAKICGELGGTAQSGYASTAYDPENRGADCAEDMAERIAEAIRRASK